jgi:diketogulonate reductase-like aldo/keto reductase
MVVSAIKAGYSLLDGAGIYANEKEVGLGIK